MIIILLGAPGSGKGTQAGKLKKRLNLAHISTGDIFRYNIKNRTPIGIKAKEYIDKGLLVPDDITIEIVKERVIKEDCKNGFILDGFPRTTRQAELLDELLIKCGCKIDYVINLVVSDSVVMDRLGQRIMCNGCSTIYHRKLNPPKVDGICDKCSNSLYIRDDDKPETIKTRLKAYYEVTKPVESYYSKKELIVDINGECSPEEEFKLILDVIDG